MIDLWERHLFLRLTKIFLLVLSGILSVYSLIDLSIHGIRFFSSNASLSSLLFYYLHSYSLQLDLLCAFATLFSALILLNDLVHHSECIALHMAGLSKRRLMRPLLLFASFLFILLLANAEWVSPKASLYIDQFRSEHAKRKKSALREFVHTLTLEDNSELIYQRFCLKQKTLFDVYWLCSHKELWHIHRLELTSSGLIGFHADHFIKSSLGPLELAESCSKRTFSELRLSTDQALSKFIPYSERKISTLLIQMLGKSADKALIRTQLLYKLTLPLLPLLIALLLPPVLLQFSRNRPTFLIASASIFALISFHTILGGMLILAENQVLSPLIALGLPWTLALSIAARRFCKI